MKITIKGTAGEINKMIPALEINQKNKVWPYKIKSISRVRFVQNLGERMANIKAVIGTIHLEVE